MDDLVCDRCCSGPWEILFPPKKKQMSSQTGYLEEFLLVVTKIK